MEFSHRKIPDLQLIQVIFALAFFQPLLSPLISMLSEEADPVPNEVCRTHIQEKTCRRNAAVGSQDCTE